MPKCDEICKKCGEDVADLVTKLCSACADDLREDTNYVVSVDGQLHRPFNTKEEADIFVANMQAVGFDCILLKEERRE